MRILLVSCSWPSNDVSGVPLIAAMHATMLLELGHEVHILGSYDSIRSENVPVIERYCVWSRGSGAIYAPARVHLEKLFRVLRSVKPDAVIVEAWQTALTDKTIEVSAELGIPVLMVSHGIGVHAFGAGLVDRLRALGWLFYKTFTLPRLVSRISALTALDTVSTSRRFFDRDLWLKAGKEVHFLPNPPVNLPRSFITREARKNQILLIGYFSAIKNQRSAIRVASSLKGTGYQFLFVGRKSGRYYKKCRAMVDRLGLTGVVTFKEDSEIALADELASSVVVMSTSVTEALPINLVEAMAAGTPFVSYQVGAVPSLHGGVCVRNEPGMSDAIMRLVQDEMFWGSVSRAGRSQYKSMFTYEKVRGCLGEVVNSLVRHC